MTENNLGDARSRRGPGLFSFYERDFALARATGTLVLVTLGQIFPVEGARKKLNSYFAKG